ncbi:glycosyltransferase family 39 protein [[Mycobacterium] crassicus]|uniref:Glycosyltransferase family 39 protein n=1 Tax=[Mycobacterium] crassicus TaxID=2872309 RepID=A0ABU5XPB0_9MYCO|nr:glycosyltransferase family 39 protein [Mycolicibacter sp. MYC098]MEB3024095.1 glycosyltransferase family 39 protein [Mycolicibacter sp. MYC098]
MSTTAGPARRWRRPHDAVVIAVAATVISAIGASRPSIWFDEAATISASTHRSLPELWRLLTHIDAVHGLYYLFMHGWFAVFPATEFWSRLPSCLAVGVGAGGVVVLCRQFSGRQLSVCAGVLYAVLPRVTWAGVEARPYAFAAAAAVWLTVLCVGAARRNTVPLWAGYGAAVVASTLLNLFTVLVVAAHPVVLSGRAPSARRRWATATGVALAVLAPFLVLTQNQIRQVAWIHPLNLATVVEIAQEQYFEQSIAFAILAWLVLTAAVVAVRHGARPAPDPDTRRLVVLCATWMLVPTLATLAYSVAASPIYYPRYLIGTAPAMAIVLAVAVTTIAGSRRAVVGLVVVLAVAAAPNYVVGQRDRYTKEKGWDYSAVADVIDTHARAGDCLLIDNTTRWLPGPIRALPAGRPAAFAKLIDPGLGPHRQKLGRLWDGHLAVWALTDQLNRCPTIWTITDHDHSLPAHQLAAMLPPGSRFARTPDGRVLHELGFHVVERWQFTFSQVIKSTR